MKLRNKEKCKRLFCYAIVGMLVTSSFLETFPNSQVVGSSKIAYATSSIKKTEQSINNAEQKKKQLQKKKKALESKIASLEKEKDNILVYI